MIRCTDPHDIHSHFIVSLLKSRMDDALSLYHDQAAFVPGFGQEAVYGCTKILEQLEVFQKVASKMELVNKSLYVAGDSALVNMQWKITGEDTVHTAMDVLIKNDDGTWQFLIDNPYGV